MLSTADINSYIAKAQRSLEANMLTATLQENAGEFPDELYEICSLLSSGIDVLNSNHGLKNHQVEDIVQEMIEVGNLNYYLGNPIPYLVNTTVVYSGAGIMGPIGLTGAPGAGFWTMQSGIVASGTTQGTGYGLTCNINFISTCAAGKVVVMPPATPPGPGQTLYVKIKNNGANNCGIFPNAVSTIDQFVNSAANATLPAGLDPYAAIEFYCNTVGIWQY